MDYSIALNLQLSLGFLNKKRTSADSIKYHALKIKEHLDKLADLSDGKDEILHKAIAGFFGEYFFNMIEMFQKSLTKLNQKTPEKERTIHINKAVDLQSKYSEELVRY
jgi:hypothetical protein